MRRRIKGKNRDGHGSCLENKELMRRTVRSGTKKKIIDNYVFSVLNYGCESWTWNKAMIKK